MTTVERTIADVAARGAQEWVVQQAIDEALARGRVLPDSLLTQAQRLRARRAAVLTRLVQQARAGRTHMRYKTAAAFRVALEARLLTQSRERGCRSSASARPSRSTACWRAWSPTSPTGGCSKAVTRCNYASKTRRTCVPAPPAMSTCKRSSRVSAFVTR